MQNSQLLVDIGNSNIHWSLDDDYLSIAIEDFKPSLIPAHQSALVSCVAHDALISNFNNTTIIRAQAYKGLAFSYDFKQLGTDRFLAIIAAYEAFPAQTVMVIDVGTFVTIDVIQHNQHKSIGIAPGLGQLKQIRQFQGDDSQNAWTAGIQDMFMGYIEKHCAAFKGKILITGGGQNILNINGACNYQNLTIQGLKILNEQ